MSCMTSWALKWSSTSLTILRHHSKYGVPSTPLSKCSSMSTTMLMVIRSTPHHSAPPESPLLRLRPYYRWPFHYTSWTKLKMSVWQSLTKPTMYKSVVENIFNIFVISRSQGWGVTCLKDNAHTLAVSKIFPQKETDTHVRRFWKLDIHTHAKRVWHIACWEELCACTHTHKRDGLSEHVQIQCKIPWRRSDHWNWIGIVG